MFQNSSRSAFQTEFRYVFRKCRSADDEAVNDHETLVINRLKKLKESPRPVSFVSTQTKSSSPAIQDAG